MAHLDLSLLGGFTVRLDGQPAGGFVSTKARALLAYLAVEADRPHRREAMAALLWPERSRSAARANLSQALSNLRFVLGDRTHAGRSERAGRLPDELSEGALPHGRPGWEPFLLATAESIQFNLSSDHHVDATSFLSLYQACAEHAHHAGEECPACAKRLSEAVALYRGGFLQDLAIEDSVPFEEWAAVRREQLHRQALGALQRLAMAHERRGEYERGLAHAWRQVELDPWREEGQRQLMRLLALSGQRGAALAQYEACRRALAEELGVEPEAETVALHEAIRHGTLASSQNMVRPCVSESPRFAANAGLPVTESPRPLFVAREEELAQLDTWLQEVLGGQGRVGFVVGEPGSGKTTLLREFAWRAMDAHPELIAARGACNAYSGIGDPYLPFLDVLQTLLGDIEARRAVGGITHEHARRLRAATPDALDAVLQVGPALVDTLLPGAMLRERARNIPNSAQWVARVQEAIDRRPGIPSQAFLFEQVTRVLQALALEHPLLLLLDDLQWSDVASISLLFHLGRRLAGHRILVLGAYRPEEVAAGREGQTHPLQPVVLEFQAAWSAVQVDLAEAEGEAFVQALVDSEPHRLSPGFRQALYRHTGGHALFSVELLRGLQERGDLVRDGGGCWTEGASLDWNRLPKRVEAAIEAHVARLPREEQELLSVASVEGEEFHAEVAARIQGTDEREVVQRLSGALTRQHRLVLPVSLQRRGEQSLSRYRFRHYLFQQYLYQRLDRVERARLHEEVGNTLEGLYGGRPYEDAAAYLVDCWHTDWVGGLPVTLPDTAEIAPHLARHFQMAGLTTRAVLYLYMASRIALLRSATDEALAHLAGGVRLLQLLPDAPERARQEFALQYILHFVFTYYRMWDAPEAGRAAERALELARQIGEPLWIASALYMLGHYYTASRLGAAQAVLEEAIEQAQQGAPALLAELHCQLGTVLAFRGQLTQACEHWRTYLAPFASLQGPVPNELAGNDPLWLAVTAWYVWLLGYPDRATRASQAAFHLAQARHRDPITRMIIVLDGGLIFHHVRREVQATLDRAEELSILNQEVQSPSITAPMAVYRGWALAQSGRAEEGIASMRQGLADFRAHGDQNRVPHFSALLAEGYLAAGQPKEGLTAIAEALEIVERADERYYEAEIHRIQGELLLLKAGPREPSSPALLPAQRSWAGEKGEEAVAPVARPTLRGQASCRAPADEAEACFRRAIAVARGQEAKSFELRATISLARLLRGQGRAAEAREMLAAIYGWFSEGFDTPDLREARALLDDLG